VIHAENMRRFQKTLHLQIIPGPENLGTACIINPNQKNDGWQITQKKIG